MEDLRGRITRAAKEMRGSNQRIAIYMRDHYDDLAMKPINQLAQAAGVSQSTVFRFAQAMGYSGYPDMKVQLSMQLQREEKPTKKLEIEPGESSTAINHKLAGRYKIVVDETSRMLDDKLVAKTVKAFAETKQIIIYGAGASSIAADALALKLTRIGRQAVAVRDLHMAMMRVVTADPDTVFVVISNWGQTRSVLDLLQELKKREMTRIVLTARAKSKAARLSSWTLLTQDVGEAHSRAAATTSLVSQMYTIDLLMFDYVAQYYDEVTPIIGQTAAAVKRFQRRK
ncbi:MurR/RpiR family transcriptional regulator [Limosilactobacillus sp.]|uniref:MurR/RpiR family transcriptional regulator n=1 Tax=Limosilactobacillus sp. TaxID=2773925 RepID=UPI00345E913A